MLMLMLMLEWKGPGMLDSRTEWMRRSARLLLRECWACSPST